MAVSKKIQMAAEEKIEKHQKRMDLDILELDFIDWLKQIKLPIDSKSDLWIDYLQVTPPTPEDKELESGLKVRLSLKLFTKENKYLISVLESFNQNKKGRYALCCHVNWKGPERRIQKMVDEGYVGHFDDILKSRHTIWAQTLVVGGLQEALNCVAKAILEHELVCEPSGEDNFFKMPHVRTKFPQPDDI
jgi:hypothetical protein